MRSSSSTSFLSTFLSRWTVRFLVALLLAAGVASITPAFPPDASSDGADPYAACKLRPLCDTDADCYALCGVGQGKCIHSRCPIRICRCS